MPKITKQKYKKDLKDKLHQAVSATYDPNDHTNKGLKFWVDFHRREKKKFDDDLGAKGDTVE